jgi:hypothetical protein
MSSRFLALRVRYVELSASTQYEVRGEGQSYMVLRPPDSVSQPSCRVLRSGCVDR